MSEDDGGAEHFIFRGAEFEVLVVGLREDGFGLEADALHDFDAFKGVFTGGGFCGEHNGIGALEDGGRDIGDFCASGDRVSDHGFEHVGSDDDRFTEVNAAFNDGVLEDGDLFVGAFDTEVTAGDHNAVGDFDDGIEVTDSGLVFNFGDDAGFRIVCLEVGTELGDIVRGADEGESEELDVF